MGRRNTEGDSEGEINTAAEKDVLVHGHLGLTAWPRDRRGESGPRIEAHDERTTCQHFVRQSVAVDVRISLIAFTLADCETKAASDAVVIAIEAHIEPA